MSYKIIIFFALVLSVLTGCSLPIDKENDSLWTKYTCYEKEIRNYYPLYITIYHEQKQNKSINDFSYAFKRESNKYVFISGCKNSKELHAEDENVKTILSLIEGWFDSDSLFINENIKLKLFNTEKIKNIRGKKCKQYKFNRTVTNKEGKKYREKGIFWLDIYSGVMLQVEIIQKISPIDRYFIPFDSKIKMDILYNKNNMVEEIITDYNYNMNLLIYRSDNYMQIKFNNFIIDN